MATRLFLAATSAYIGVKFYYELYHLGWRCRENYNANYDQRLDHYGNFAALRDVVHSSPHWRQWYPFGSKRYLLCSQWWPGRSGFVKPIATLMVREETAFAEFDFMTMNKPSWIYDGAYLNLIVPPNGTVSGTSILGETSVIGIRRNDGICKY